MRKNLKTILIKSNNYFFDPRLIKEAKALVESGYNVEVLSWDRETSRRKYEIVDGVLIKNFRLKAPYGPLIVFYYPLFWIWVFINIVSIRPLIIHACNLDSGLIGYLCWKLKFCNKFIFDVHDSFPFSHIPPNNKILFNMVYQIENKLFCQADAILIPSETRAKLYKCFDRKFVTIILNSPPDVIKNLKTSIENSRFTVVYAGAITADTGILEFAEATMNLDVDLILAGRAESRILSKLIKYTHIKYLGLLSYEEALDLQSLSDVIVAFYKPIKINAMDDFAEPSKIYEAMMLRKPIISNVKTKLLKKYNCGIPAQYGDIEKIKEAIKFLMEHPEEAYKMGQRGRKAFEMFFQWDLQHIKLIKMYRKLINS